MLHLKTVPNIAYNTQYMSHTKCKCNTDETLCNTEKSLFTQNY